MAQSPATGPGDTASEVARSESMLFFELCGDVPAIPSIGPGGCLVPVFESVACELRPVVALYSYFGFHLWNAVVVLEASMRDPSALCAALELNSAASNPLLRRQELRMRLLEMSCLSPEDFIALVFRLATSFATCGHLLVAVMFVLDGLMLRVDCRRSICAGLVGLIHNVSENLLNRDVMRAFFHVVGKLIIHDYFRAKIPTSLVVAVLVRYFTLPSCRHDHITLTHAIRLAAELCFRQSPLQLQLVSAGLPALLVSTLFGSEQASPDLRCAIVLCINRLSFNSGTVSEAFIRLSTAGVIISVIAGALVSLEAEAHNEAGRESSLELERSLAAPLSEGTSAVENLSALRLVVRQPELASCSPHDLINVCFQAIASLGFANLEFLYIFLRGSGVSLLIKHLQVANSPHVTIGALELLTCLLHRETARVAAAMFSHAGGMDALKRVMKMPGADNALRRKKSPAQKIQRILELFSEPGSNGAQNTRNGADRRRRHPRGGVVGGMRRLAVGFVPVPCCEHPTYCRAPPVSPEFSDAAV